MLEAAEANNKLVAAVKLAAMEAAGQVHHHQDHLQKMEEPTLAEVAVEEQKPEALE
jgi:hypothetical protein